MLNKKNKTPNSSGCSLKMFSPASRPDVKERAVYSYLLRHSLVVGKLRLQFAVMSLARTLVSLSERRAMRCAGSMSWGFARAQTQQDRPSRGDAPGGEIRALRRGKKGALLTTGAVGVGTTGAAGEPPAATLETGIFLKTWALRKTISSRTRHVLLLSPPHSR